LIHESQADLAADRRNDSGIRDLQIGVIDLRLIGLNSAFVLSDGRCLRIELLPGNQSLIQQQLVPLTFRCCRFQQSLIARELALGLSELNLKRAFVDFRQEVALIDELAFPESDINELTVDPAPDRHGVRCGRRAETAQINRHVDPLCRNRDNRRTAAGAASSAASAPAAVL
jgi:hypothetical protein